MKEVYISIIIPCYNEMANLQKGVLQKVERFLSREDFSFEVIIVDDGSTDGSIEYVEEFIQDSKTFHLIKNPHQGKAGAVTTGMLSAKGEYRLFTDMDQATPIEEIKKLLPFVKDYDIVIGSRQRNRRGAPLSRKIMAQGMVTLRKIIVGIANIHDTQCGFKIFRGKVAEKLFPRLSTLHHGFKKISGSSVKAGFDVELLYLAEKIGYSIKEVPVIWLYVETRRVSPVKDSVEALIELIKIRKRAVQKKYD